MTRINTLAILLLTLAGLNIGVASVFDYNLAADVLNGQMYDIAAFLVGISGLVAIADRFGWTHDAA